MGSPVRGLLPLLLLGTAAAVAAAPPEPANAEGLRAALAVKEGRPLLVHLWASWCRPCIAEWPHLAEALRGLEGRALDVLVVSIDEADAVDAAAKVLAKAGELPGRSLLVPPADALPVLQGLDPDWDGAVPTTLIVGKDGRIILAQRGATRMEELTGALDRVAPAAPKAKS